MIKMKKAFSLLIAIFTILLLSLVASYIYYTSSSIAKEGELQYQEAEAKILARSYTEYAILALTGNNPIFTCIDEIKADIGNPDSAQGYKVIVNITYIGNNKYINKCSNIAYMLSDSDEDTLSVILDVYVKYKEHSIGTLYTPWRVYHKRSLQKI